MTNFFVYVVIELDNYLNSKIILDSDDKFENDNEIFEGNSHVSENDFKEIEWDESYQNLLTDEELRDIEINDLCKEILQIEEDL